MVHRKPVLTTRRLVIASVTFGLFVLFDLFLFGWLILKSLSQREIEKVLLETRQEAEPLAEALRAQATEHGGDIFVVVSVATETQTYIDEVLNQRDLVRKIEIHDRDGNLAFGPYESREELAVDGVPSIKISGEEELDLPMPPIQGLEQIEVPIGEFGEYGTLVIGLSNEAVQRRIGVLRQDLTRQATLIGALTLVLLTVAFVAVWKLFRRAHKSEEQAIEAERLAYVGTLASGLAHEIRNPLNSLNLNMQMLEEEARERSPDGSEQRLLSLTRSELARLEGLATDFLNYARPRQLELSDVPAVELMERVLGVLAGEIQESGVEVSIEDRSQGAHVKADRGQLGQLLLNLTRNALAAAAASEQPRVRLGIHREAAVVVLEVADNGPGIPEDELGNIFDLFYSTKKGGTGLGLAIVRRIALAHGAEIGVESSSGQGTTMRVSLPAVAAETDKKAEVVTTPG